MMNENPSDAAQRAVEAIDEAYAKATPGEWGAFNCDDSHFMNMWGLTVYGPNAYGEPNDEDDLGNVLMVSCVQVPARFVCENDDANLDFIALAHNHWPAARAHIRTLEEQVARLSRWIQPKITLSIGLDYHDCEIVDVGHSEVQLMIRCPDLEADVARLTAEVARLTSEVDKLKKPEWYYDVEDGEITADDIESILDGCNRPVHIAGMKRTGPVGWYISVYDEAKDEYRTLGPCDTHAEALAAAAALASGGQAGKGN